MVSFPIGTRVSIHSGSKVSTNSVGSRINGTIREIDRKRGYLVIFDHSVKYKQEVGGWFGKGELRKERT